MGREVIKGISEASDMTLIGAIARHPNYIGEDAGEVAECGPVEIQILNDLQATLVRSSFFRCERSLMEPD